MADQYGAIFSELERLFNRILRSYYYYLTLNISETVYETQT